MALQDHLPHPSAQPPSSVTTNDDEVILALSNNITIRRHRPTDATSLSHHGNDTRIWDNLRNRMPHPYLEEHAKFWIETCNDPGNWITTGPWTSHQTPDRPRLPPGTPIGSSSGEAIPSMYTITVNDEAVGGIGLEFGDIVDVYARTAELGYWLGCEHHGKGVMSQVVPAFVQWSWRTFGRLVRINGYVSADNAGSVKCLQKAGLEHECVKKAAFVKNGRILDEILLGMVRPGLEQ